MDISEQSVRAHYGEFLGVGESWEVVRVEIDYAIRRIEVDPGIRASSEVM